jgi:hypothetical protein
LVIKTSLYYDARSKKHQVKVVSDGRQDGKKWRKALDPKVYWIRGWVGPKACLDSIEKRSGLTKITKSSHTYLFSWDFFFEIHLIIVESY